MLSRQGLTHDLEMKFSFSISPEMMTDFGRISGDLHPVHINDVYARDRGFKNRIVYGGLLVAQVSRLIGAELPVRHCIWTRLTMDFTEPLYVNEVAVLTAQILNISDAVGALSLKFRIAVEERLITRGRAEVVFANA